MCYSYICICYTLISPIDSNGIKNIIKKTNWEYVKYFSLVLIFLNRNFLKILKLFEYLSVEPITYINIWLLQNSNNILDITIKE